MTDEIKQDSSSWSNVSVSQRAKYYEKVCINASCLYVILIFPKYVVVLPLCCCFAQSAKLMNVHLTKSETLFSNVTQAKAQCVKCHVENAFVNIAHIHTYF